MTDQPTADLDPMDADTNGLGDEPEVAEPETIEDVELSRCDISFLINIRNVNTLLEAVDIAAANLGRFGMDSFYILATDPDTGRQWIISNGEIQEADAVVEHLDRLKEAGGE